MLDHRRDAPPGLEAALRRAGYDVRVSRAVDDSAVLVAKDTDWALTFLNPLVVDRDGIELAMLEQLQAGRPVPVIVVVGGDAELDELRRLRVPLRDFVTRPYSIDEVLHRADCAEAARVHLSALQEQVNELHGQVTNDFKTELLSERHFRSVLHVEFKRAQRNHTPLSLLLVDVDNFKSINDTTDYAFGDEVLRSVAATLKGSCRETDFPARFGGDEFVVLLPQTSPAEAVQTALRIRKRVADSVVRNDRHATRVTISIGIDTYDGRANSSAEELRRRANKALQEAKRRGKNRTWLYSEDGDTDDDEPPPTGLPPTPLPPTGPPPAR